MKFINLAIPFLGGVLWLLFCKTLPQNFWFLIAGVMLGLWLVSEWYLEHKLWLLVIRYLAFVLFGFCWVLIIAKRCMAWSLPTQLEGKSVVVEGYLSSLPVERTGCSFFTLTNGVTIKLVWCGEHPNLHVGDKWRLNVRLKRPHGTLNPGGFDLEKNFFYKRLRATGYVVTGPLNRRIRTGGYQVNKLRQKLRQRICAVTKPPIAQLIVALVVGDSSGLTANQWQVLRATGTSYLVAIAGLHIGLVASLGKFISHWVWRWFPSCMLRLPATQAGFLGGLILALFYSVISGFAVPTQRALLMFLVLVLANLLRRQLTAWDALLLALFVVLLLDPLAVLSAGFCLSFTAVAVIIFISCARLRSSNFGFQFIKMQLGVFLGLMPFSLALFQQVSFGSLGANIIAMPGVCFLVTPLSLVGASLLLIVPRLGALILWLSAKLMALIWLWLEWVSKLQIMNWQHAVINNWILLATIIGVILLLAPRRLPGKWLGIFWLLPLIYYQPPGPKMGEVWFTLLDVGQGLAAVVQTKEHVLVYDTGPKYLSSNAGETIVIPFLRNSAIKVIDMLVLSHEHSDHVGGALALMQAFQVKQVYSSIKDLVPGMCNCYDGITWHWDHVTFQFLAPSRELAVTGNNASCVLRISSGSQHVLLVGDIERATELWLSANHPEHLPADILVAPHHGSRTSSHKRFIAHVKPRYVLFPIGYRNRFRFPSKQVMKRYLQLGAKMYDTAATGAIFFKFSSVLPIDNPTLYRVQNRRFWHSD